MLHSIAIDDEPSALEILERYAAKTPFLTLEKVFYSTTDALAFLQVNTPDLIFLDIQMPDMAGTEFARLILGRQIPIVFTTAHAEFAVEGFNLHVADFLLKPFDFPRFLQACQRVMEAGMVNTLPTGQSLFVREGHNWVRVNLEQVCYIQSDTNLLFIYEQHRRIVTRMTLTEMIDLLPTEQFMRVHKSYIVALHAVEKVERHQLSVGKTTIPLAAAFRDTVIQRLGIRID
jgi:two-component system, LytTR family, response regulator